jgi:hypothetical protein
VNALIPLTTRPKRPFLAFGIQGANGGPAHLITRASTAALEAEYLFRLALTSPVRERLVGGIDDRLLEAICVATPDLYRSFYADSSGWTDDGRTLMALERYLHSGLGSAVDLDAPAIRRWARSAQSVGRVLSEHLGEAADATSSSEMVLLSLPRMDPRPMSAAEIDTVVNGYCDAVHAAHDADDDDFLTALAEYGRRVELIVEAEVPVLEPATIKLVEDRRLSLTASRGGWTVHRLSLGDARSFHAEARVSDPTVVIAEYDVRDLEGEPAALGPLESARSTDETLSLYSSEAERPYYVDVALRLVARRHLRLGAHLLVVLTLAASAAALVTAHDSDQMGRLALLVVPTTLAATFALIREQTALATRLLAVPRSLLAGSIALLWVIALVQVVTIRPVSGGTSGASRQAGGTTLRR